MRCMLHLLSVLFSERRGVCEGYSLISGRQRHAEFAVLRTNG